MALITTVIGKQAFELIRDRIASILVLELSNQVVLGTDVVNPSIWTERLIPFNNSELPALNVNMSSGGFSGQTIIQSNGTYLFNIDCYVKAPSTGYDDGDVTAMLLLQRLIGVCRAILEASQYKTLDFPPPFISSRHAQAINISTPKTEDSESVAMGRLTFEVKAVETAEVLDAILLVANYTQVKISLTNKGYQYKFFGPNPSITLSTPVIDFNVPEITIPFTYNSLDPLGKYIVLVSTDNGATFSENTNVGQCNLDDTAVFPIGNTGVPAGSLLIKFRSVDNPVIESNPISAITDNSPFIQSYVSGKSTIGFSNNGGDDWDIEFKITPDSSQLPSGFSILGYIRNIVFWAAGTDTQVLSDSAPETIDTSENVSGNGEGVYYIEQNYAASNGTDTFTFQVTRTVKVDDSGNILYDVHNKGCFVTSTNGLTIDVSSEVVQVGVTYPINWLAFDGSNISGVLATGANASVTVPSNTLYLFCFVELGSEFLTDMPGGTNASGSTINIS